MKIGIGITTYNREDLLDECLWKIAAYTRSEHTIYVARDTNEDRRGIAYRKNECLRNLKDSQLHFSF